MKKGVVAERVGFEPTVQETCTPVFETGTLNHSDTSPRMGTLRQFTAKAAIVKIADKAGWMREVTGYGRTNAVLQPATTSETGTGWSRFARISARTAWLVFRPGTPVTNPPGHTPPPVR